MSNIFEALKRAEREHPELALPLDIQDESKPEPPAYAPAVDIPLESAVSAAPPATEIDRGQRPDPGTYTASTGGQIHSLGIRVSAGVPVLPFDGSDPRAGEQYRMLRTKLIQHPRQPRLCVITSPGPGDGKTITSINLAGALALRTDAKVVLVDADLRRPSIAPLLGVPDGPGLTEVLMGTNEIEDVLIRVEQLHNLYVIPAGKRSANPTELLDSTRWVTTCKKLREQFRFAILDVTPVGAVADYDLIQAQSDGILMVLRQDHTNRNRCFKALEMIPKEKMIGVVLNCVAEWFLWKTSNYYYYSDHRQASSASSVDS